ncbi:MAG TPA: DUF3089 domain-containing protein [Thermoleophilaceae bacterium]|nr:DUF3089 domain-containing protein [Thermoleophilaceae bacterium]
MSRPACLRLLLIAALTAALVAPGAASAAPKTVWLCKPGLARNPCTPGLKTTYYSPAGKRLRVRTPRAARPPKIDCFYVYPTVSDQTTTLATLRIDPEQRSIALYQSARYSQHCRVFAPMYRQVTVPTLLAGNAPRGSAAAVPYADVRRAWRTYLRKHNKGRGVVIVGHSQGTFVLRQLVSEEIDPKPKLRRRLVSALLLGGNVTVKRGRDVGGDFKHVRACRSKRQLGCVVAFSTFNAPVPEEAFFGRTATPGLQVLCTNPAALGGGSASITPVYPSKPFAPGTIIAAGIAILGLTQPTPPTPWIESRGAYSARCSTAGGASVLQTTARAGSQALNPSPDATWGLHLTDANIALGDLVDLVGSQTALYLKRRAR